MLCTLNIENGVGWNKNICKLSCEKILGITVFCAIKLILSVATTSWIFNC